jgi:hypothetical protein
MRFLSLILDQEIMDHNKTRERLHRYMQLYMMYERAECSERVHGQYLDTVIANVEGRLEEERERRKALEKEKTALLEESFNNFTCVSHNRLDVYHH